MNNLSSPYTQSGPAADDPLACTEACGGTGNRWQPIARFRHHYGTKQKKRRRQIRVVPKRKGKELPSQKIMKRSKDHNE
jgi:hypothetical protein